MERAISVFIWTAVVLGFAYGLVFTGGRIIAALGGAAIFGAAAMMLVGVGAVLSEVVSRQRRADGHGDDGTHQPGKSDG